MDRRTSPVAMSLRPPTTSARSFASHTTPAPTRPLLNVIGGRCVLTSEVRTSIRMISAVARASPAPSTRAPPTTSATAPAETDEVAAPAPDPTDTPVEPEAETDA